MRRKTWFQALSGEKRVEPSEFRIREALAKLDDVLFELWALGEKTILVWTQDREVLLFLAVPHYAVVEGPGSGSANPGETGDAASFVNDILEKSKYVDGHEFETIRKALGRAPHVLRVPFPVLAESDREFVSALVSRYGITLVPERAVILLDVVGFSLRSPLHQVSMLNSLSYSVNAAYSQLLSRGVDINFARTTTGDGFYIWNRGRTIEADIELYKLLMLILADNAVAQRKAARVHVPQLRAAFHVGNHYEFYQVEGLNPTTFGYIVGQVTIELARMIEKALPGQIVVGDFNIGLKDPRTSCNTRAFVERTASTLDQLEGLAVGADEIRAIRCYLTGPADGEGNFSINRYAIADKHGKAHFAYNAKVNIHCARAEPLFLGVQHRALHQSGTFDFPWPVI